MSTVRSAGWMSSDVFKSSDGFEASELGGSRNAATAKRYNHRRPLLLRYNILSLKSATPSAADSTQERHDVQTDDTDIEEHDAGKSSSKVISRNCAADALILAQLASLSAPKREYSISDDDTDEATDVNDCSSVRSQSPSMDDPDNSNIEEEGSAMSEDEDISDIASVQPNSFPSSFVFRREPTINDAPEDNINPDLGKKSLTNGISRAIPFNERGPIKVGDTISNKCHRERQKDEHYSRSSRTRANVFRVNLTPEAKSCV